MTDRVVAQLLLAGDTMLESFQTNLFKSLSIPTGSRILTAVSGGRDSVALLHLLVRSNVQVAVAHVNFQLRGDESDDDEAMVHKLAEAYALSFYVTHFDTAEFARERGLSIQMAARKLRYDWFQTLAAEHGWQFIATAHHLDDQIETFFINLLRGTGLEGLKGIAAKNGNIIRPMLAFSRSDIEEYIKTHQLEFREDSSNKETDYLRNRIRHQLIPVLSELQPAYRNIMAGNLRNLSDAAVLYNNAIETLKNGVVSGKESVVSISLPELLQNDFPELLLYEILCDYSFNSQQVQQIWQSLDSQPGKIFLSPTHRLLKDREQLIIQTLETKENQPAETQIEQETTEVFYPIHLQVQLIQRNDDFQVVANPDIAILDLDCLRFPLKIRKWKQGDRFKPLGMKGSMKLSDFFVSQKYSLIEKENAWLLTDAGDEIIWIVGHRISDHHRIKTTTKTIYKVRWFH